MSAAFKALTMSFTRVRIFADVGDEGVPRRLIGGRHVGDPKHAHRQLWVTRRNIVEASVQLRGPLVVGHFES